ncbi:MAG TPA: hypothetical protein VGB71_16485 [Flavisolibacter sp.]|jgi:uncharacterized coiled-coil protein SlyX
MEDRIAALEATQNELTDAIMEINTNLASIGYSTTESIKAIMEGFQSMNNAMHGIIQNFSDLEVRIQELENRIINCPFTNN